MKKFIQEEILYPYFLKRDGIVYKPYYKFLKEELKKPYSWEQQFDKIKSIVKYAFENSVFYKNFYSEHGFHPSQLKTLDDIRKIPILEKQHIQQNLDDILVKQFNGKDLIPTATGGTTGNSFKFFHTLENVNVKKALTIIANEKIGWRISDKFALIWAAHQDLDLINSLKQQIRQKLADKKYIFDATSLSEEIFSKWHEQIYKKGIAILYGYVNPIYEFANFFEEKKLTVPPIKLIVTTAEPLYPSIREKLKQIFNARIVNRYASREHGIMAQECEFGNLHIFIETIHLETEKNDNSPSDFLVTDFYQKAVPFIRYRIGDTGTIKLSGCPCGSDRPYVEKLTGRTTDFLISPTGKKISGMALHEVFFDDKKQVPGQEIFENIQFIQDRINHLIIRIVKGVGYQKETEEKRIRSLVNKIFDADMNLNFEYVESIEKTQSGKYRFTINLLDNNH